MSARRAVGAWLALVVFCAWIAGALPRASAAAGPDGVNREIVLSKFKLRGTNGYAVEVTAAWGGRFPPTVALAARRGPLRATYEVQVEREAGIHAAFGTLGRVAVDFRREKRTVDWPEKDCALITETGVFEGEFLFAGERGYTSAEETSVPGEIARLPNGFCGFGNDRVQPHPPDLLSMTTLVAEARISNGLVSFGASEPGIGSELGFGGAIEERAGSMQITRSASARVRTDAGVLASGGPRRSVLLDPPPPFRGSARFQDPANGPPTWTGSLSVSLPGAPGVALAGPSFSAKLCLNRSILRECKLSLPPVPARPLLAP